MIALKNLQTWTNVEMDNLREFGNEKRAYSCTSKKMDMVEMSEDLDDKFSGKVLNSGDHVYGVEFRNLGDAIWGRAQLEIGNGRVSA